MHRLTLILLMLCCGMPLCAEDSAVAVLIAQLSAEDFDDREAAAAKLIELGESVWPQIRAAMATGDAELRHRGMELCKVIGTFGTEHCEELSEALGKLYAPNPGTRAEGLDQLLLLGVPGIRRAQMELTVEQPEIQLEMTVKETLLTLGQAFDCAAALHNRGSTIWLRDPAPLYLNATRECFSGSTRMGGGRRLMVRRGFSGRSYINPIWGWQPIGKGLIAERTLQDAPQFTGIYRIVGSYNLPFEPQIAPRLNPAMEKTVNLTVNKNLSAQWITNSKTETVMVLPDFEFPIVDSRLELIARVEAAPKNKELPVTLTLQCRLETRDVALEPEFMQYAWYAVVDARGKPVRWGNLESLLVNECSCETVQGPPSTDEWLWVKSNAPQRWSLRVPLPSEAGEYSVVFGYEISPNLMNVVPADMAPLREDAPFKDMFNSGKLYTRLTGVRVGAKP